MYRITGTCCENHMTFHAAVLFGIRDGDEDDENDRFTDDNL